jgi:endoglucanase
VIFGLMNEPKGVNFGGATTEEWLTSANSAIAAIRGTGAENLVLVPGNGFTGAWSWTNPPGNFYGTPNAQVMGGVVDSFNNFAYEVHQYLDADSSGSSDDIVSETIGAERLVDFTNWLRANNARGFVRTIAAHRPRQYAGFRRCESGRLARLDLLVRGRVAG